MNIYDSPEQKRRKFRNNDPTKRELSMKENLNYKRIKCIAGVRKCKGLNICCTDFVIT